MDSIPSSFDHIVPVPGLVSLAQPAFVEPGPAVADRDAFPQKDPRRDAFWYRRIFTVIGPIPDVAQLKVHKAMFGSSVILNRKPLGEHLPCFTPGYFDARAALNPNSDVGGDEMAQDAEPRCLEEGFSVSLDTVKPDEWLSQTCDPTRWPAFDCVRSPRPTSDFGLKEGENELLVRIGADRDSLGAAIPSGFDFEKERYIPGIFDSVELILSGTPHIVNVQAAPDIARQSVRVQTVVRNAGAETGANLKFVVRETKSREAVGAAEVRLRPLASGAQETIDITIALAKCRLWSPEDPFLYDLEVDTGADRFETRFGMREFYFDPVTRKAVLNGQPYFMRGSNVTLYRFFEDSQCKDLPWNQDWVRDLHRGFKKFHWNCLRYCIGFPPEAWYRIADEEGFLIQDEFPIWHGGKGWPNYNWPPELNHHELIREFTEWIHERSNHPCVVLWDAQNETETDETGLAIKHVRSLDLSNRPWDNGFGEAAEPGDTFESHTYHFQNPTFKFKDIANVSVIPEGNNRPNDQQHPIVINEYGWLWLNRDGSLPTLTAELYQNLLGPDSSAEQRFDLYARYLAAETEFWRCHRQCAAIMHFTAIGYSRSNGQTSDHFTDAQKLVYEPAFLKYVPDSFAPVGLMVDFWNEEAEAGARLTVNVIAINDLHQAWSGAVTLRLLDGRNNVVQESVQTCTMDAFGTAALSFDIEMPCDAGLSIIEATLKMADGKPVRSVRHVKIVSPA